MPFAIGDTQKSQDLPQRRKERKGDQDKTVQLLAASNPLFSSFAFLASVRETIILVVRSRFA
jgi:hypothetical protein